eukprot:6827299-Pyramimonas_sp.AAC.1
MRAAPKGASPKAAVERSACVVLVIVVGVVVLLRPPVVVTVVWEGPFRRAPHEDRGSQPAAP